MNQMNIPEQLTKSFTNSKKHTNKKIRTISVEDKNNKNK